MINWRQICLGAIAAIVPLLGGCNTSGSLKDLETSCAANSSSYNAAWSCVRNQNLSYDEYRSRYIANGDVLAAQVNAGQVSDAAARASMSSGFNGGGGGRR
jgi:hypothetical protein